MHHIRARLDTVRTASVLGFIRHGATRRKHRRTLPEKHGIDFALKEGPMCNHERNKP
jgi:hypothetical protein